MDLRKEQIMSRYKQLFPVGDSKDKYNDVYSKIKQYDCDYKRVLIISNDLNYRVALSSLLLQYIAKYKTLPKFDMLGFYELVHFYFKDYDESMNLNKMDLDVFAVTAGFNEPKNKMSIDTLAYIANRFYFNRDQSMWIYLRGSNPEIVNLCKDLDYTIIDLNGTSSNRQYSPRSNSSVDTDLF